MFDPESESDLAALDKAVEGLDAEISELLHRRLVACLTPHSVQVEMTAHYILGSYMARRMSRVVINDSTREFLSAFLYGLDHP